MSAATKWKGKPHALAFEARVRCGVAGEDVGGEKTERKPPRARVWGEGEGWRPTRDILGGSTNKRWPGVTQGDGF